MRQLPFFVHCEATHIQHASSKFRRFSTAKPETSYCDAVASGSRSRRSPANQASPDISSSDAERES